MTLSLKALDRLDAIQADGLIRPAVHGVLAVLVAFESKRAYPRSLDAALWHAAS
jgi:hypothetical protein